MIEKQDQPTLPPFERWVNWKYPDDGELTRGLLADGWNAALQAVCEAECENCKKLTCYIGNGWHRINGRTFPCFAKHVREMFTV